MHAISYSLLIVDDLTEISLQRSAANQSAVDIGLCETALPHCLHLQNRRTGYELLLLSLHHKSQRAVTDTFYNFLSLLCGSRLACTDRPDRLVSDDHAFYLICSNACEVGFDLQSDPVHGNAHLSLLQSLAAAKDRNKACFQRLLHFPVQKPRHPP